MRARWLVTSLLTLLAVPAACGDGDTPPNARKSPSNMAGEGNGLGGAAGAPPTALGGIAGSSNAGDAGSGAISEGGLAGLGAAGMPENVAGIGGLPEGAVNEQLTVCARLLKTRILSNEVVIDFDKAIYFDPCLHWTTLLFGQEHHADFLNHLALWNLKLWGCQGDGVGDFALLYKTAPLSAGDAELLIARYIEAATKELELSPAEADDMRAALERLAKPVITDSSPLPSHAECFAGAGGAGGTGGVMSSGGDSQAQGGAG